jgi:membrane-bound lytic murein transglycosylase D
MPVMLRRLVSLIFVTSAVLAACSAPGPMPSDGASQTTQQFPPLQPSTVVSDSVSEILPLACYPLETPKSETDSLNQPASLWETLRQNFALPEIDNPRITVHREWYLKHPEYLSRVTERARYYAGYIEQEVRARAMPAEIALLPIVESAYDAFAYSHGRAAGLWQFIPTTGKRFGLTQNWWYDGRRDVVASTQAALDYLTYLNRRFDGDWFLALAAYNSGEGTVLKAQRRNRNKGKPEGFWALDLPRETREYVPKLIALKQIIAEPRHHDVTLEQIPAGPQFEVVEIGAQIDLAVAADLAEIDLDYLYRLNPGFNQWATAPDGPHRLLIPVEQSSTFRESLASLPPEKRLQWVRHKIESGETLSHIAAHYGTTVNALREVNDLKGSSIRTGRHLLVPLASKETETYALSAQQRLNQKKSRQRAGRRSEHVVGSGDTLWELSNTYKVSVRRLASWNGIAPGDPLRVGQKLVIWTETTGRTSAHPGAQARPIYYRVRNGDSLSRISTRFKVRVADLRRWNGLPSRGYLQPGQKLKLYVDVTKQTGI